jgi:hypothetical protein
MSPIDDNVPTPDDERFDLLVDGELPEPERRQLLSELDRVPGGWRRCALAFLEAQGWKQGMQAIRGKAGVEASPVRFIRRTGFPGGLFGALVAMAASFLIALGIGLTFHSVRRPRAEPGRAPTEIAAVPQPREARAPKAPAPKADEPDEPNLPATPGDPDGWQLVAVPVRVGPEGSESIRLPARPWDRVDERWMDQFAPSIPPELREALQRGGHEVRWSRRFLPFRTEDGQQLVVPLEQVELHYVGDSLYQ